MSGKYGLIIANTEYTDPGLAQLTAPGKDAEELWRVLNSPDLGAFDDVMLVLNQDSARVNERIEIFFSEKKPDDLLLLYFSGHGVRDENGTLYLAVKNTSRNRLRSTAVSSSFVKEVMDESRSKRQVLILDCCNSGAFAQGTKAATGVSIGTATAFGGYGHVVLTASDSTQYAWEGDKVISGETENSLFTHFLVKGLEGEADRNSDGQITVDELYEYAYEKVKLATPKQTPSKFSTKQQGEIILRQGISIEDIPLVSLPKDLLGAMESPYSYIREGAVKQLILLLNGRNLGLARSAREALENIAENDDSRTISRIAFQAVEALRQTEQAAQQNVEAEQLATEEKRRADLAKKERLARQRAEEERLVQDKDEADRKAKEEAERLVTQKAEEERLAKQKAEEERQAKAKAEAERKAKEEADRLAAQKAEEERLAKAEAEADRKAKETAIAAEIKAVPAVSAPKKPASKGLLYGGIAVVLLVVAGVAFSVFSGRNKNSPVLTSTISPTRAVVVVPATKIIPTNTAKPTNTPRPTPSPMPKPIVLDATKAKELIDNSKVTYIGDLAVSQLTKAKYNDLWNAQQTIPVTIKVGDGPVLFGLGWCAKTQDILTDNLKHIGFSSTFDGIVVPDVQIYSHYYTISDGESCFGIDIVIDNWTSGEHNIKLSNSITQKINDGFSDAAPGEFVEHFVITVP